MEFDITPQMSYSVSSPNSTLAARADDLMTTDSDDSFEVELTAQITAAYVSNNPVAADQLPDLIGSVFNSVSTLSAEGESAIEENKAPAVSIKKSLQNDHLVCLEDGLKFKSLKRHLRTHHGLTPGEYRAKWGLKPEYPMVAPDYAARRSQLAKDIGLGNKGGRNKK